MTEIPLLEKAELILTHSRAGFEVNAQRVHDLLYSGHCQSPQVRALLPNSGFGCCAACLTQRIFSNLGARLEPAWAACKTHSISSYP